MSSHKGYTSYHQAPVVHNSRGSNMSYYSRSSDEYKSSGGSTTAYGHSSVSYSTAEEKYHRVPDGAMKEIKSIYRDKVIVTNHEKGRYDPAEDRYGRDYLECNSPSRSRDSAKNKEHRIHR